MGWAYLLLAVSYKICSKLMCLVSSSRTAKWLNTVPKITSLDFCFKNLTARHWQWRDAFLSYKGGAGLPWQFMWLLCRAHLHQSLHYLHTIMGRFCPPGLCLNKQCDNLKNGEQYFQFLLFLFLDTSRENTWRSKRSSSNISEKIKRGPVAKMCLCMHICGKNL